MQENAGKQVKVVRTCVMRRDEEYVVKRLISMDVDRSLN